MYSGLSGPKGIAAKVCRAGTFPLQKPGDDHALSRAPYETASNVSSGGESAPGSKKLNFILPPEISSICS